MADAPINPQVRCRQLAGNRVRFTVHGAVFHYQNVTLTARDGTFMGRYETAGGALDAALAHIRLMAGNPGNRLHQPKGGPDLED